MQIMVDLLLNVYKIKKNHKVSSILFYIISKILYNKKTNEIKVLYRMLCIHNILYLASSHCLQISLV